jgi:hypothetical protein
MKHINEPAPRVAALRPDVPARLDEAIATALAKDPDRRFARMDDFRRELQACLAELRAGTATPAQPVADHDATVVLPPASRPRRRRSVVPLLLVLLGLGLLAGVGWVAYEATDGGSPGGSTATDGGGAGEAISLSGVGAFDPEGTGGEHDADAPLATDGDATTSWRTEDYKSPPDLNGKSGVGLVLDAGSVRDVERITFTSETPGFEAQIRAGDAAGGPFRDVSASQTAGARTTYELDDARARYFVVWITTSPPGGTARVNEVTAS